MSFQEIKPDLTILAGLQEGKSRHRDWVEEGFLQAAKRPDQQIPAYLALCEYTRANNEVPRAPGMLKTHLAFLERSPSQTNLGALALGLEGGENPDLAILLDRMVEYPLNLAEGIGGKKEPTLKEITDAAIDLVMPLCEVLQANLHNESGARMVPIINAQAYKPEGLINLLLSLRNKHTDPSVRSALEGGATIILEALDYHRLAGNLPSDKRKFQVSHSKIARFPNRNTDDSEFYQAYANLEGQFKEHINTFSDEGFVLRIQEGDPRTKKLVEMYLDINFKKMQLVSSRELGISFTYNIIQITPDSSIIVVTPHAGGDLIVRTQRDQVQNSILAVVAETRQLLSKGRLTSPEVGLEHLAHIVDLGIRDLDGDGTNRLEETRSAARASLCGLSPHGGEMVLFSPEDGSGLYDLGFDQVVFYPNEGGLVAHVTILGSQFELVFDQSYQLQRIGNELSSAFPPSTILKIEATLLEYVREIRSEEESDQGNVSEARSRACRNDADEQEVDRPVPRRKAHMRVLPVNHRSGVYEETACRNGKRIDPEERERILRLNDVVRGVWGISLLELNTLFFIAQDDANILNENATCTLQKGAPLPEGVLSVLRSLVRRTQMRDLSRERQGPHLFSVTFVEEVRPTNDSGPNVNICTKAAQQISSRLTGPSQESNPQ